MPCLNEARTVRACIDKARASLTDAGVEVEIVIADNGSTDGSQQIARDAGARVVDVAERGYGSALAAGIAAARGRFVIMGDADDSYDFAHLGPFVERLRAGDDLVMGNRFAGGIAPGAMPPLHRYLGNPVLTGIGRLLFKSPCGDFHCGLRGFRKEAIQRLDLRTTGMEFASEMVVKATLHGLRISEIPTTLSPDGRDRRPHLRSWRDGWRHLRFLLLYSPRWLFLYPGLVLMTAGIVVGLWLIPGPRRIGRVELDVHTLLYCAAAVMIGFQSASFAVLSKVFAVNEGLLPPDAKLSGAFRHVTLEGGLVVGAVLVLAGVAGSIYAVASWGARSFGPLVPQRELRIVIPAVTSLALGCQIVLNSFFLSVLNLRRR
jgi:glycosyltransferase involved in cell wall biosynthesis